SPSDAFNCLTRMITMESTVLRTAIVALGCAGASLLGLILGDHVSVTRESASMLSAAQDLASSLLDSIERDLLIGDLAPCNNDKVAINAENTSITIRTRCANAIHGSLIRSYHFVRSLESIVVSESSTEIVANQLRLPEIVLRDVE